MNQKISTWLGTVILIIISITTSVFIWKYYQLNQINFKTVPITVKNQKTKPAVGIANPASVYCEEHGGKLEIRTGADGGQTGFCKLTDGTECEEWQYFRGECSPANVDSLTNQNDKLKDQLSFYETGIKLTFENKYDEFKTIKPASLETCTYDGYYGVAAICNSLVVDFNETEINENLYKEEFDKIMSKIKKYDARIISTSIQAGSVLNIFNVEMKNDESIGTIKRELMSPFFNVNYNISGSVN